MRYWHVSVSKRDTSSIRDYKSGMLCRICDNFIDSDLLVNYCIITWTPIRYRDSIYIFDSNSVVYQSLRRCPFCYGLFISSSGAYIDDRLDTSVRELE